MLTFVDVALRRGPRLLFSEASFTVFRGEKAGLTGANGSGKSSLLALLRHEIQPDAGEIELPGNVVIGYVAQELPATERIAIEFVLDGDTELRAIEQALEAAARNDDGMRAAELHIRYGAIGGYDARSRAARLMHGLGFSNADEQRRVVDFSGGWRVRLNLAQALMCRCDLMLLDEPTNHLDLDAIVWLENWLREFPGTLLLISHDREFLDRIVTRILHIEQNTVTLYTGNYSDFEGQRAERLSQQQSMYERQQREIAHMMSFIERFRAKASKATQAQSRLKALERMQRIAPAHVDSPFAFTLRDPLKLPRPLLSLDEQSAGYGGPPVLEKISLTLSPGDRIGLLGRNGAGKSTLMKLLADELEGTTGTRTEARDLRIGYFAQHQLEQLQPNETPLDHLNDICKALSLRPPEQELRTFLGGFGFQGDRAFEPVGPFSGGEKARLVLALVSFQRPNLLLLDEPTNHLDLEMREALTFALQEYTGAVVLVSHDRHLLRSVADELYLVGHGRVRPYDGDVDAYARLATDRDTPAATGARGMPARERQRSKREEAERRQRLAPMRAEVGRLETELSRLQNEQKQVETRLTDASLYEAGTKNQLQELLARQKTVAVEIERVEAAWLTASEVLDTATADIAAGAP